MKAAIYDGVRSIRIQDVERAPPPPGHVLLDTKQTGICGTDLHSYLGHWEPRQTYADGHEYCGVIAELGEGVTDFALGDVVVAEIFWHCGHCVYCRTGQYNHCLELEWNLGNMHRGFAEYTTAPAVSLFKLPEGMSFEQGALVEPLAVAVRALAQAQANYQDRVAIIGGGTIGLLCLAVAKAAGVKEAWITTKYAHQARIAALLGADQVVQVGERELRAVAVERTQGAGADVVIETVGGAAAFDEAAAVVRPRGTIVLAAMYPQPVTVDLQPVVMREVQVVGSICYGYSGMTADFQTAIDLIASGRVDPTRLVTHRFGLDEIGEAFAVAADKHSGSVKVHVCQA